MTEKGSEDRLVWVAGIAGVLGALMATLDISIVNTALPKIQGEIGASQDEGTWVSTAYLIAEIIMIPMAHWFSRMLSLRNFLLIVTVGFICFSMLCGFSTNLVEMIMGRVGQGLTGGAMIPTALNIVATRLPPEKRSIGVSLFAMTAILGPILGPAIGGWLTEYYTWHYAFFINLPIGIGLLGLLIIGLKPEKMQMDLLARADWFGILGLIVGLSCFTVITEEGERLRWFEDTMIDWLAVFSVIGFITLITSQFTAEEPIIDLKILATRSFGSVFVMGLIIGGALYGTLYLIPQFLTEIPNYNPATSGYVVTLSGVPALLIAACFPLIVRYVDVRIAVGLGFILYSASCFIDSHLTPYTAGPEFVFPQILRGFGQALCMIFLNQAATSAVSKEKLGDASGLFNAARNLGGSIGLSVITRLHDSRNWLHVRRIEESLTRNSVAGQDYMHLLAARFPAGSVYADSQEGLTHAYALLTRQIETQASVMTYSDIFYIFAWFLIGVTPAVLFLKPLPQFKGRK